MLLIKDDRTEKVAVRFRIARVLQVTIRGIGYIIPKDGPILLLGPNVGALVDRHLKLDSTVEEVIDVLSGRLLHSNEKGSALAPREGRRRRPRQSSQLSDSTRGRI